VGGILLSILSLALTLALVEVGFRLSQYVLHGVQVARWRAKSPLYEILPGSALEYRMIPLAAGERTIVGRSERTLWRFRINRDGFRGEDILADKPPGTRRLLVLGDSYAFGWGVDDTAVFPEQLEAPLTHRLGRPVEAINLAVPGYNTVQEHQLLLETGDRYAPDVVLVAYAMNDAEPQWTVPPAPRQTYGDARLWALEFAKDRVNATFFPQAPVFRVRLRRHDLDYVAGFRPESGKWRNAKRALAGIADFARARGVPLVVLIVPDFTEDFDASYCCALIHARVSGWARELGAHVVDLLPHFEGTDHEAFWIEGDGHPNARAHRRIAEILVPVLSGLLDE
jgi:lysophospholipase L1-like esterase